MTFGGQDGSLRGGGKGVGVGYGKGLTEGLLKVIRGGQGVEGNVPCCCCFGYFIILIDL